MATPRNGEGGGAVEDGGQRTQSRLSGVHLGVANEHVVLFADLPVDLHIELVAIVPRLLETAVVVLGRRTGVWSGVGKRIELRVRKEVLCGGVGDLDLVVGVGGKTRPAVS